MRAADAVDSAEVRAAGREKQRMLRKDGMGERALPAGLDAESATAPYQKVYNRTTYTYDGRSNRP